MRKYFSTNLSKKILMIGGDHSVSYPSVLKWIENAQRRKVKFAIIHFDAHTDLLDKRLGIDICFGSWAFHMIEKLNNPKDLIQLGIRSSGYDRGHWEQKLGVQQFWADEISQNLSGISKQVIQYLNDQGIEEVYLSFDIDALDSKFVSATGTPEANGMFPHHAIELIKAIGYQTQITGADLVEVAPFINSPYKDPAVPEPYTTLQTATSIMKALLEQMQRN
jgi:agmatinase